MKLINLSSTGQSCHYVDSWLYCLLYYLKESKDAGNNSVSRDELISHMGNDEDDVKEMLTTLRNWGALKSNGSIVSLTESGSALINSLPVRIVDFPHTRYVIGNYQCGVVIRGISGKVTNGILQRNCAVKAGAKGASVFVRVSDNIFMPPEWKMEFFDPVLAEAMRIEGVCDEDVVIIAGADSEAVARNAAVSAALETL